MIQPPTIPALSPGGARTCPSVGPLDAKILLVGENPADQELRDQIPFVGQAGRVLNKALSHVQLPRDSLRIVNLFPGKAAANKFENVPDHERAWGRRLLAQEIAALPDLKLIVALGNHPLEALMGLHGITKWRGSLFPPANTLTGDTLNEYWTLLGATPLVTPRRDVAYMGAFHPAAVSRQMSWHIWLNNDLRRARDYVAGNMPAPHPREWHINDYHDLSRFVDEVVFHEHAVGIDTEMDPHIVALVSEEEVHVFEWNTAWDSVVRPPMERLLTSSAILKIAHNMAHDWLDFEVFHGIRVVRPWFDTLGGAHILEPSGFDPGGDRDKKSASGQLVGKSLSPHIATKFTSWPYHKWLVSLDPLHYCGMDSVVGYDAYWSQIHEFLQKRDLLKLVTRDMVYFEVTLGMTRHGVLVDEVARLEEIERLRLVVDQYDRELNQLVDPVIDRALAAHKFRKPHLFQETRVCTCCRGAKNKRAHCWSCAGFDHQPKKTELQLLYRQRYLPNQRVPDWEKRDKAWLEEVLLFPCSAPGCPESERGRIVSRKPFNWDSPDQVGDLFYRALGQRARSYKGSETTRVELLARMLDDGGHLENPQTENDKLAAALLQIYVARTADAIDLETVSRLEPDAFGRIRSIFDLWYTPTARVASREGLHFPGTNLQNIPKESRRFIVPDPGYFFVYPDYRQVEGRALVVLSGDSRLMEIYKSGGDSHQQVADLVAATSGVQITRDQGKRTFFSSSYGVEADHLAEILGVTHMEALKILNALMVTFPGLRRYRRKVEEELRRRRSNTTPTGYTRRWLGYVLEERGKLRGQVKKKIVKEALASSPQYIGAYVLAEGLMAVAQALPWITLSVHVHDAGLVQVPNGRAREGILALEDHMAVQAFDMDFPVDASPGPNWYIASLSDQKKTELGYAEWTRDSILANGVPAAWAQDHAAPEATLDSDTPGSLAASRQPLSGLPHGS